MKLTYYPEKTFRTVTRIPSNWKRRVFQLGLLVALLLPSNAYSQLPDTLPECINDVPLLYVDLSTAPDSTYISPSVTRTGECCGASNSDRFVSFYATLHPNAAMVEIGIADGADPFGSGAYHFIDGGDLFTPGTCVPEIPAGQPVCIPPGIVGPNYKIAFSKPGNNTNQFFFRQILKPTFPQDDSTRIGCSLPLDIYGLENIVIQAILTEDGSNPSDYNGLMDVSDPSHPIFNPGAGTPMWIDYEICGSQEASLACGVYETCDTVRIYTFPRLTVNVTPNPASFCVGGSVDITANPAGGFGTYSYSWSDGSNPGFETTQTITVSSEDTYEVAVSDGLISPTCPAATFSIPVTEGQIPTADAGPATTAVCADNPETFLIGTVTNAGGGTWSGGLGTFNPSADSLVTSYTPTEAEINNGSVTLTLTSTDTDESCATASDDIVIYFSDTLYANPSYTALVCNGDITNISSNVTGGSAPLTYSWSSGSTSPNINASAGTYSVTATDTVGCTVTANITVTEPDPIVLTTTSTDESADGACDGSVSVSASGGSGSYLYDWNMDGTGDYDDPASVGSLCYGVHTVVVQDSYGCESTISAVVSNITCSSFAVSATNSDLSCYGDSDASATATPSGGAGGYLYSWNTSPIQTNATATGLTAGTYTVTVSDIAGCVEVASVTVLQPTVITNTMTWTDATSIGGTEGTATANPLGGNPGYTYVWSPAPAAPQTTQTVTGLSEGTYYVDITDQNSCVKQDSVHINQPPCNDFYIYVNSKDISCFGLTDGSAYLNIAGGTGPYTINWSTGDTGPNVSGLSAGSYSVTVTDNSACTTFATFDITEPAPLSISLLPNNVTCFGAADGTIDLTVTGGVFTYSFEWTQGSTSMGENEDLINLGPNTYSVSVTDANGCNIEGSASITQPSKLITTPTPTPITCNGAADGSVDASTTGGTAPYTYAWAGPNSYSATTQDISGLDQGQYFVLTTDASGCTHYTDTYINEPEVLDTAASYVDSVTCLGDSDGTIDLDITGGTMPYSYSWTGPASFTSTDTLISGLVAGDYTYTLTDARSCTTTGTITVATVVDITNPVVTCTVADQTVSSDGGLCTYTVSGTAWDATATDNCLVSTIEYVLTGATTGSGTSLNGVAFELGTTTVTWTATDNSGNTDVCSYDVTVEDNELPAFTACVGSTQTVSTDNGVCSYTNNGTAWDATATDNCSVSTITYVLTGATTGTGTTLDGVAFGLGTTTVTWTVTDGSGNSDQCSFDVVVEDNELPTFTACIGSTQNVVADPGVCTYTVSGAAWDAVGDDNCTVSTVLANVSGVTTATGLTTLDGFTFNPGTSTVTWTVTDGSGNTDQCIFDVVVSDDQDPAFSSCGAAGNQNVVTDAGSCFYTHSGNSWNATATDNCTVSTVVADLTGATTASGLTTLNNVQFNLGTTTVTWTVTDNSGNSTTCTFDVIVTDNQNPVISSCGGSGTENVTSDPGLCDYTNNGTGWDVVATDNCTITSSVYTLTGATTGTGSTLDGVVFNLGITTVTWTVTDNSSNVSTCSFSVNVTDDEDPAIVTCGPGSNQTVDADNGVCTYTNNGTGWDATATDNCTVASISYALTGATTGTGASLDGVVFNLGTTTVTWTATDGSGNTDVCSFTVTVEDNQLPVFTACVGSTQNVVADNGVCTYTVSGTAWDAVGDDNCTVSSVLATVSGATTASGLTTLDGFTFNPGTSTVTWTVTDGSGNTDQCIFDVVVTDDQDPAFTSCGAVGNQSVVTDAGSCFYTHSGTGWNAIATDNCTVSTVTAELTGATTASGLTTLNNVQFNLGTTTVTWTVTDNSGNSSTCSFDVTVTDNQNPVFSSCGANGSQNVTSDLGSCDYTNNGTGWDAVVTDNCTVATVVYTLTGVTTGTGTSLDGVVFNLGTTTVTWTATDNAGNVSTCSFNVNVSDDENPTIVNCGTGSNETVDADPGVCTYTHSGTAWDATATDNCSVASISYNLTGATSGSGTSLDGETFNLGTTTVTWSVTDNAGNSSTCSFTVTVLDAELPQISCVGNIESCDPVVTFPIATATDNCGLAGITQIAGLPSGSSFPVGTTTITYQATDASGNTNTCSFDVIIHPIPVLTLDPTDISCNGLTDGSIDLTVSNSTAPYTYTWSNGDATEDINGLSVGLYSVTVVDTYGCTNTGSASIAEPDQLAATKVVGQISCYGSTDGYIDLSVTGGVTPYSYSWSNGATSQDIVSLSTGVYTVDITDANGCLLTNATNIVEPDSIEFQHLVTDATCNASNGTINVQVTGGTTPYNYSWSNGLTTQNLTNASAGIYTLTLTDDNGCLATLTDSVQSTSNIAAEVYPYDVSCFGEADGSALAVVQSGNAPYAYVWSNGDNTDFADSMAAGSHSVTITDAFGCLVTVNFDINQPDSLHVELSSIDIVPGFQVSPHGNDNGSIYSYVTGGTPEYEYAWAMGSTDSDLYNLTAGTYYLTVTDANRCKASATITLLEPSELDIPEGVTPNGDLDNDYFVVRGLESYPDNDLTIYNRWGNIVYSTEGYQNDWEGQNNGGEALPDGTYYVVLNVFNGDEKTTLTGYIDLRRSR